MRKFLIADNLFDTTKESPFNKLDDMTIVEPSKNKITLHYMNGCSDWFEDVYVFRNNEYNSLDLIERYEVAHEEGCFNDDAWSAREKITNYSKTTSAWKRANVRRKDIDE